MGAKLPVLIGREAARTFGAFGWQVVRQASSHLILTKPGETVTLSVPDHNEVAKGTLRSLIRSAHLTVDDFVRAR